MQDEGKPGKLASARVKQALRIKHLLALKGLTLADIDRQFSLSGGTARNTLREPNAAGESAISAALAKPPEELWPDRYCAGGRRKSPQDYSRPPTLAQRRKNVAA